MSVIHSEWYIIVNPHAGSGKTMCQWIPAERKLKELGVPFYTVYTTHKHHATELAAAAARMGYRKIMAVGGDGSIHEVFSGVVSWCEHSGVPTEDFYLAVTPIGSGNDWIKAFNVPSDSEKVIELVAQGTFTRQDIVRIVSAGGKVSYMANIGGLGFDSHVCDRVNSQKERGKRSPRIYVQAVIHQILHPSSIDVAFSVDGEKVFEGSMYSVSWGTGKYSGGGMRQCCLADPADGILDAMLLPKLPFSALPRQFVHILKGTTDQSKKIHYFKGKTMTVVPLNAKSADIFEMDGEIEGTLPMELTVTGRQINVLCNPE